jgi:hypothetical protein
MRTSLRGLLLAWAAALTQLAQPASIGGAPPCAGASGAAAHRPLLLRGGGKRDGGFTVLAPRELSAKGRIRDHLKRVQAQREEARELARTQAREALYLARQVGAACAQVDMGADGAPSCHREEERNNHDGGRERCPATQPGASAGDLSSAIVPNSSRWGGETNFGRDGHNLHVYLPEDASLRALLDCAQAPVSNGLKSWDATSRPERQLVLYKPSLSRPLRVQPTEERVTVVDDCDAEKRIEEIADDQRPPDKGEAASGFGLRIDQVPGAMDTD